MTIETEKALSELDECVKRTSISERFVVRF